MRANIFHTSVLGMTLILAASVSYAQDSRTVVVSPDPRGTPVPIQPNERIGAVTSVNLPGRRVVVVRIDPMPSKPDFNIITPNNVQYPFKNGPTSAEGIDATYSTVEVQDAAGRTHYQVNVEYSRGGRVIGTGRQHLPPGSQLLPDPPQPPGLVFMCPDALPATPEEEAIVLIELGISDTPETQVWDVPSGEFLLLHPGAPEPEPTIIESGSPDGDINYDGCIDLVDLSILLSGYGTVTGATYGDGDLTGDGAITLEDLALLLSGFGMCG